MEVDLFQDFKLTHNFFVHFDLNFYQQCWVAKLLTNVIKSIITTSLIHSGWPVQTRFLPIISLKWLSRSMRRTLTHPRLKPHHCCTILLWKKWFTHYLILYFEIALFFGVVDYFLMQYLFNFFWVGTRAAWYIACDCHAHLISKAGSVIINKSPSPVFKWSGI